MRCVFCFFQTAVMFLYEGGLTEFKAKLVCILWVNSFAKACSMEANPLETLGLFALVLWETIDSCLQIDI